MVANRPSMPLQHPDLMDLKQALAETVQDSTRLLWICEQLGRYQEHLQAATLLQQAIPVDQPAARWRLALSHHLQQAGLPAHALRPLRELAHWQEHFDDALQREVDLRIELRQPQRSLSLLNKLIKVGIDPTQALSQKARLLFLHRGPRQLREQILNTIIGHHKLSSEAKFYTAWHLETEGNTDLARMHYLELLWDQPDNNLAFQRLSGLMDAKALICSVTGQRFIDSSSPAILHSALLNISRQAKIPWRQLDSLADRILEYQPTSAEMAIWHAGIARQLGDAHRARQRAHCAMTLAPGDVPLLRRCISNFWVEDHSIPALVHALEHMRDNLPTLNYSLDLLLAVLHLENGRAETAIKSCTCLCEQHGYLSKPWILHLEILRRIGKPQRALEVLRQCPKIVFTEEVALERSIAILDRSGPDQALVEQKQLHLLNTSIKALNSRALALYLLEKVNSCESLLRQSLKIHPNNPDAWNQMGIIARERANYWRAMRCLRMALHQNPNHMPAHYNLSQLHHYSPKSRHLRELEHQLERQDLPKYDRINLLFALAKAQDDCGSHEQALGLYASASQLKLSLLENFDLQNHVQFLLNRNQRFAQYIEQRASNTNQRQNSCLTFTEAIRAEPGPTPIFLVGLPRCGSTLTEQILTSIPECQSLGESKLFSEAMNAAQISLEGPPQHELQLHQIQIARKFYLNNLPTKAKNATWVTDKMLYNYTYAQLLRDVFPSCRIIAMKRQPLDAFLSMLKCNFSEGNLWTYSWDTMLDIYDSYMRFIEVACLRLAPNCKALEYEQLVQQPESVIRDITQWLGMNWTKKFLKHQSHLSRIRTASDMRARQAIDSTSVNNWKRYANALDPIRSKLIALGYETPAAGPAPKALT